LFVLFSGGLRNNAGAWTDIGWYDTWTAVEIHYQAFANSGSLTLWLDDIQKQSITFIDNDISSPLWGRAR
jgi:hypothetical protein